MSNFFRKGARASLKKQKKEVQKRIKRIYQIMDELDEVAAKIFRTGKEWSEENIAELAYEFTDLKIEGLETMMLLGKLENLKEHYDGKEVPNDIEAIRRGDVETSEEVSS
jgi:hypothetical protein